MITQADSCYGQTPTHSANALSGSIVLGPQEEGWFSMVLFYRGHWTSFPANKPCEHSSQLNPKPFYSAAVTGIQGKPE